MKKTNEKLIIAIVVLLVAVAVILDAYILSVQNRRIFSDEEIHLHNLSNSIDRNIRSVLSHRTEAQVLTQESREFFEAERSWLAGENREFAKMLQSELVDTNDITRAVLVIRNGKILLSSDGDISYDMNIFAPEGNMVPCIDAGGKISLMILTPADELGIQLGSLINLDAFYNEIISSETANNNWVLLLDSHSQLMVHYQNYNVLADSIDAVAGATCGPKGIELIKDIQAGNTAGSGSYEYWDAVNKQEHEAFLSVIPSAETVNGYFAVGVAGQVDDKVSFAKRSTLGYVCATAVIMTGIVFVFWIVRKESIKKNEELILLREKNAEMEALAQKRREMEHADRLETIGTLTSSISHEFNNLLTPIMAYSVMALEKISEDEKELGDYIEEIYNASTKAKTIISRLAYISRKSNDDVETHINVKQLIEKAAGSAAPARGEHTELVISAEDTLKIFGNELQLHQMLLNLILNAYQALGDEGRLCISAEKYQNLILISVTDNGPGIPYEIREKVFDPFFTTKGSGKGTGLGLAICRQAVEDNKGRIELESEIGKGTTFRIFLPET